MAGLQAVDRRYFVLPHILRSAREALVLGEHEFVGLFVHLGLEGVTVAILYRKRALGGGTGTDLIHKALQVCHAVQTLRYALCLSCSEEGIES